MDAEKRVTSLASGKADPGTRPGVYTDPDCDGVLFTMTDGITLLQMILTPEEAVSLASSILSLASLHKLEVTKQ